MYPLDTGRKLNVLFTSCVQQVFLPYIQKLYVSILILACHERVSMNLWKTSDSQDNMFCFSLIGETVSTLMSNNLQKNNVQINRFFLTKLHEISSD